MLQIWTNEGERIVRLTDVAETATSDDLYEMLGKYLDSEHLDFVSTEMYFEMDVVTKEDFMDDVKLEEMSFDEYATQLAEFVKKHF